MKPYYILTVLFTIISIVTKASENLPLDSVSNQFRFTAAVGTKIGGSAPLSLPAEIRKIRSYAPAYPFFVGVKALYNIDNKWGVSLGVTFEGKGMNTEATVKGYKTSFNANEDKTQNIKGYFTGDIATDVQNLYLSVPIQATFRLSRKWEFQAGPYFAFAVNKKFTGTATNGYMRKDDPTGEKIIIEKADYDFNKSVRTLDVGMSLGSHYNISRRYFALAQFDYGFNNIMKTGFESISFGLHNIFLNAGVGIKL
ncbi:MULTISPECIES: porin family protein [unclassified Sphingobacterium]|uniref:porin family protein n=1 Tax=unclassified Sphingobacterium TaxID=2609468 RepID=UPI0025D7ADA6|nr:MULTISPECIES: porin family protein [unclassified Sphingobacterium]